MIFVENNFVVLLLINLLANIESLLSCRFGPFAFNLAYNLIDLLIYNLHILIVCM